MTSNVPVALTLILLVACQVSVDSPPDASANGNQVVAPDLGNGAIREARKTRDLGITGSFRLYHNICLFGSDDVMTEEECGELYSVICVMDVNTGEWENSTKVCSWTECYDGSSSGLCDCSSYPCREAFGYPVNYGAIDFEPWT